MLSNGVEKLYELTLGTIGVHRIGAWPPSKDTESLGHKVEEMHTQVMAELRAGIPVGKQFLRDLLEEIESDRVLPLLVGTLDSYGRRGRFHYLDKLGSGTTLEDPELAWRQIDAAAKNEPEVSKTRTAAFADHLDSRRWDDHSAATQRRISDSIDRMWDLISLTGESGVDGELGRYFGTEIRPLVLHRRPT